MDKLEWGVLLAVIIGMERNAKVPQPLTENKELLNERIFKACKIIDKIFILNNEFPMPSEIKGSDALYKNVIVKPGFNFRDISRTDNLKQYAEAIEMYLRCMKKVVLLETGYSVDRLIGNLKSLFCLYKIGGTQSVSNFINFFADDFCMKSFDPIEKSDNLECYALFNEAKFDESLLEAYPVPVILFNIENLANDLNIPLELIPMTFQVSCHNIILTALIRTDSSAISTIYKLENACSNTSCSALDKLCSKSLKMSIKSALKSSYTLTTRRKLYSMSKNQMLLEDWMQIKLSGFMDMAENLTRDTGCMF